MYEENRTGFVIKDVLLQIILVVIFVFLLLWLFPTKSYVDNKFEDGLDPLYQEMFNDHLQTMKEAAQSYYTTARLPKKVGDKVSITLGEMLDKKLLSEFVDSNNKQCSLTSSYVEITKADEEYMMKVNLSCSDKSDYIIVYMGCYNYCDADLCEKEEGTKTNTTTNTNTNTNTNTGTQTSKKTYQYEYKYVPSEYSDWSSWSKWSTNKVTETTTRDVDTKKVWEVVDTEREKVDTKTYYEDAEKDVTTKKYDVKTNVKCPDGYKRYDSTSSTSQLCIGNPIKETTQGTTSTVTNYVDAIATTVKICPDGNVTTNDWCFATVESKDVKAATAKTVYGSWVSYGEQTFTKAPVSTDTERYTYVTQRHEINCVGCSAVIKYVYKVEKRTVSTKYSCDAYPGYTLSGTSCVKNTSSLTSVYGTWTAKTTYSCADGATPVNGKCPVTTTTTTQGTTTPTCPGKGSYDATMGWCYVRGTKVSECPNGIDGKISGNKCVVETVKYTCDEGKLVGTRCKITEDVYETEKVYGYVTYYRYRTRSTVYGDPITTWSYSSNDKTLLNKGYKLTGNKKLVTVA